MSDKYDFQEIVKNLNEMREKYDFDEYFDEITWNYNFDKLTEKILEQYDIHEVAKEFPLMGTSDLKAMTEDISKKGLVDKIIAYKGQVVDGQNRIIACTLAGINPEFEPLKEGLTPKDLSISHNVHRRHLKPAEKVSLALRFEEKQEQEKEGVDDIFNKTKEKEIKEIDKTVEQNGTVKIEKKIEHEDPVFLKAQIVRQRKHDTAMAKEWGTTREKIEQGRVITQKAMEDPKFAELWEEAESGKRSIDDVYKRAIRAPIEKKQEPTLSQINEKLRQNLKEWKEKYYGLQAAYDELEKKYNTLKDGLRIALEGSGIVDELEKKKKKSPFPTPEELRKAELI